MAWSMVGAEVQILVAKKTSPTRLTLTCIPGTACTMYTTWISLALCTSWTLPPVLASAKTKTFVKFLSNGIQENNGGELLFRFFPGF